MNRPIRRVVIATLVLFAALLGNLTYVQFVQADDLRTDARNLRVLYSEYDHPRGEIIVDGQAIASSKETDDKLKYLRTYANGPMYAPATGYDSLIYATSGIEHTEDALLGGTDDRLALKRISDIFTGREPKGGNVVLTLDSKAQQAAYDGLEGQRGAVVALDPTTGEILALASRPSYDPNKLSSHHPDEIRAYRNQQLNAPGDPLLDKATEQSYPPGSTFKTVIAAAALEDGKTPDSKIPAPDALQLPQSDHQMHNFGGESCNGGAPDTLIHSLTISCNTSFGQLGMDLGEEKVREQAEKFGIDDAGFTMPLQVARSTIGDIPSAAALATSSIGQQDVSITPMQAAMIASAIANDGTLMEPHLVKELQAPDLTTLDETEPEVMSEATSKEVADQLTDMMVSVVDSGTGTPAQIPGVEVAGKTGTADNAPKKAPHAWFIGFAPAENPKVAVAVLIENGGVHGNETTGGEAAAPIAKSVMQAVLAQ